MPSGRRMERNGSSDRDGDGGREGGREGGRGQSSFRQRQSNSDEQALTLRDSGRSYAAVASSLGLKRASDARAAFLRAVARLPDSERTRLYQRESERLDRLEARIRDRDRDEPEKMERRLAALAVLRETMPQS